MNSLIHSLNDLGATLSHFVLAMLVQSSVLIVALFLLDLALRKKVRAVVRYPLWLLVLLKLVLPPSFAAPTGLAYWFPETEIAKPSMVTPSPVVVRYSEMSVVEPPVLQTQPPPRAKLQLAGWLLLVWLAITAGLMALLVRRSRSVVRRAALAFPASESPEQLLDACREQMGVKQRVRLKLYANAGSPAVCGLWRPVILIPQTLADKLSALQLRAVLFHELAHIQRGDVWINYAQSLLQIFYWWHPLLWLASVHIRRVREQAVDERVMVEMGREAEAYPNTLLEVAKLASRRPMPALGFIGIVESKSALAQRIRHLLDRPPPKSAKLGFARLAAVALVGAALLPMARGERKQVAQATALPPQSLSQTAAIEVEVIFVSLTHAAFESLLGFRPKTIAANGHFVWTFSPADQAELLQRMERQPDVVTISAPRVTTTNARQAQMAVDGIQPFLHPSAAHTSASFQILPHQIGGSFDLDVSAKLTETGDVGSLFGADLGRYPKDNTNDASPRTKSNQVYAVNAVGYINYDVGTAQTLVGDGGAVILQNPALTGADGRRILVVVSPRILRQFASAIPPDSKVGSPASSSSSAAPPRDEIKEPPAPATIAAQALATASAPNKDAIDRIPALGDLRKTIPVGTVNLVHTGPGRRAIQIKLQRLMVDEALFDGLPLQQVLSFLSKEALKRDPDMVGISFLINPNVAMAAPQSPIDPSTGQPINLPTPEPFDMKSVIVRINPPLKNVCLADLLEAVTKAANPPMRYSIEEYAVIFSRRLSETNQIELKPADVTAAASSGSEQAATNAPSVIETNPGERSGKPSQSAAGQSNSVPILGDLPFVGRLFRSDSALARLGRKAIQAKLNRIVLPEIVFDHVPLPEVVSWLAKEASHRDPDGTGLNFLLVPNVIRAGPEVMVDPTTGNWVALPRPEPLDMNTVKVRINPPLKNVRLSDALEAIVNTADKPIRYSIEDYAVIFSEIPLGTAYLETRIFRLDPNTFAEDAHRFLLDAGWSDIDIFGHANDWKDSIIGKFLKSLDVSLVPPNTIFYTYGTGMLMVRATADELDRVQKAIEKLNALRQNESASQPPAAPAKVREGKVSRPSATEELVVTLTAQHIYLGSQPVTLEELKTKLAETRGWNPKPNLVVKADRDAPVDRVGSVLESARSLNIEPFITKLSESIRLETRVFRLDPATLLEGLKNTAGGRTYSGTIDSIQDSLRALLTAAGVNVKPPNAVFFNHRTGVLMVRATSTELDIVQKALELLNYRPPQITIETRFMEMPTEAASKLGLDLPPPDAASETWTRILTGAQAQTVLRKAEQLEGVTILSAPKVTTLSGRQTQIQVSDVNSIAKSRAEALPPPGLQSNNMVTAQPELDAEVKPGHTLDVLPLVRADGYTIQLSALSQATELLRYDNTPDGVIKTGLKDADRKREARLPLSIIRALILLSRRMQAAIDVYDGQTLVLGKPKVTFTFQQPAGEPVGFAFPEDTGKRLVVFITPTIIDPAGNPIHNSGNEPWADKTPPQPR